MVGMFWKHARFHCTVFALFVGNFFVWMCKKLYVTRTDSKTFRGSIMLSAGSML